MTDTTHDTSDPATEPHVVSFGRAWSVAIRGDADAYDLADAAVICDIESEGVRVGEPAARRWDIRPMIDPREHAGEVVDMARKGLAYAMWRGLIELDADTAGIVRIVKGAA